jgi:hypothetical protein
LIDWGEIDLLFLIGLKIDSSEKKLTFKTRGTLSSELKESCILTIGKINNLEAVKDAEEVLKNNPELSGDVKAMMNLLLLVIKLLVDKMGLNSQNSSIPPSKDPTRNKGRIEKSGKKPGGTRRPCRNDSW